MADIGVGGERFAFDADVWARRGSILAQQEVDRARSPAAALVYALCGRTVIERNVVVEGPPGARLEVAPRDRPVVAAERREPANQQPPS